MREGRETGGLRFRRSGGDLGEVDPIERSRTEQSNTSIRIGGKAMLKGFRKLEQGTHPELEVGRFLTEVARFPNTPALLGSIERVDETAAGPRRCASFRRWFPRRKTPGDMCWSGPGRRPIRNC